MRRRLPVSKAVCAGSARSLEHPLRKEKEAPLARERNEIVVRALRTRQGAGLDVYAFFIKGANILNVADITRIERDESDVLKGFQRGEIRNHVKGIIDYLSQGNVL